MTWIQTAKGRAFDLLEPRAEDVDFDEIGYALARINRFTGHAGVYSVAQHCAHGCDYLESRGEVDAAFAFLLHDAHEAYLGDLSTPLVGALRRLQDECDFRADMGFDEAVLEIRQRVDLAIWSATSLRAPSAEIAARVREIDLAMLRTERDQLMLKPPRPWIDAVERATPLPINIDHVTAPEIAERRWLGRFHRLSATLKQRSL